MRRPGEDVEDFSDSVRMGIGQVEAFAVEPLLVRQIVERVGDKVDRNDVDAPTLDADSWHPRWQHLAQFLDQFEEVVRTVDLVDVAGLRMADDEAGAIDAPRPLAFFADDPFRHVLGPEVRMIEVLGFLEHVFSKDAVVEAGGRDRTHMVEASGLNALREFDGVARAVDVGSLLILGAGGKVVDRCQVEKVLHLPFESLDVVRSDAQAGLAEITGDRDHLLVVRAPHLAQCREFAERALAHQEIDRFAVFEQVLDEKTADEPGSARNEISHRVLPWAWCAGVRAPARTGFALSGNSAGAIGCGVAGIIRRRLSRRGVRTSALV